MTFYGLTGEEHPDYSVLDLTHVTSEQREAVEFLSDSIHAVGIIEYDKDCVDYYKLLQGSAFSYTTEKWYFYSNPRTSSSGGSYNSDEETCYAYGTSVVRRSSEGRNENIPIEDVKEGD